MLVISLGLGAGYLRVTGSWGGDPAISTVVADAGGALRPGADVKVRGVIVGRVERIVRDDGGDVRLELRVPEEALARVPANVVSRVLPATVFGTTYVDLALHEEPDAGSLRPGAVIPADTEQDTIELQQALDDIDRLVSALGPAELASAIGAVADALDGRGAQLGDLLESLDSYLARLRPLLPLLRSDLAVLADALEVVDQVAPQLLGAAEDSRTTLRTIASQQEQLAEVLRGGSRVARHARALLGDDQEALVEWLEGVARTVDAVYDHREAGIAAAIETNLALADIVAGAVREGFVRVDALLRLDAPDYYTPADRPRYGGAP
nr:MCE family protein [Nocardioides marinus]